MKSLLVILSLLVASLATASEKYYHFDCRVVKVLDGVFEEGLSVDEYPDVYMVTQSKNSDFKPGETYATVGAMGYDRKEGSILKRIAKRNRTARVYKIDSHEGNYSLVVSVSKKRQSNGFKKGNLYYTEGRGRPTHVAILVCK